MKNIKIQQIPEEISAKKDIIVFFNKKIDCFRKMIFIKDFKSFFTGRGGGCTLRCTFCTLNC